MSKLLKDPIVVEHVKKVQDKQVATTRKVVLGQLKAHAADHISRLGDDKAAIKAVKLFHAEAQTILKQAA